jgi:hypothetical protein
MVNFVMPSMQLKPGFEEVFTVTDYYDGPRQGVANYQGLPHFYDCFFSEHARDYSNLYRLTPVSHEAFQLALEDWAIWERWERAFHAGETNRDTHPALPEDRDRHLVIKSTLDEQLKTDVERCVNRVGAFLNAGAGVKTRGVLVDLLVRWSEPNGNSDSIWAD